MCRHTLIAAITISSTASIIDAPIPRPSVRVPFVCTAAAALRVSRKEVAVSWVKFFPLTLAIISIRLESSTRSEKTVRKQNLSYLKGTKISV